LERGFTLKVSTRRLGLKVLPEGNKGFTQKGSPRWGEVNMVLR